MVTFSGMKGGGTFQKERSIDSSALHSISRRKSEKPNGYLVFPQGVVPRRYRKSTMPTILSIDLSRPKTRRVTVEVRERLHQPIASRHNKVGRPEHRDRTMSKTTAFAAAMIVSMLCASGAEAISLSSMSRQRPASASDEIVTNAIPGNRAMPRSLQPKVQLVLFSIGSFLRQQSAVVAQNGAATLQLITFSAR
jgi:hypothetical protein